MARIAGFFSVQAVALVVKHVDQSPSLVCYGGADGLGRDDPFLQTLRSDLSDDKLHDLSRNQFSVTLNESANTTFTLLFKSAASGHGETRRQMASALIPHLVRSIKLAQSVDSPSRNTRETVDNVRTRLSPATIVLDGDGGVSEIDAKATALIQSCAAISVMHDRIEFANISLAQRFRNNLTLLLAGDFVAPFFMPVIEDGEKNNLVLLMEQRKGAVRGIVVYLRSMCIPDGTMPTHFSEQFGLTPKESRLAAGLMQGKNLRQLATEFYVSEHTLRTQLKSVLHKTGVKSQIALIVLMLSDSTTGLDH